MRRWPICGPAGPWARCSQNTEYCSEAEIKDGSGPVFVGQRTGVPLSDMTLAAVLKRMGFGDLSVAAAQRKETAIGNITLDSDAGAQSRVALD